VCSAAALPVEGALAPDLSRRPPRAGVEPIRELPGKRRRERTWKDEVRERVDRRRQEVRGEPAGETGLPLFPERGQARAARPSPETASRTGAPARRPERRPARPAPPPQAPPAESAADTVPAPDAGVATSGPSLLDPVDAARPTGDAPARFELDSVDLHAAARPDPLALLEDPPLGDPAHAPEFKPRDAHAHGDLHLRLADDGEDGGRGRAPSLTLDPPTEEDWPLVAPRAAGERRPVERPAGALERVQAALIDAGVLIGLGALVVYFAGRVAQVPLSGLRPAWPFLAAYLVFLGLVYASYFTGTTGQTVGKILLGLRVVDSAGHAPGYARALARGALGALGTLAAGLGLVTVLFDPAHRALHDRVFRTRVVSLDRG
jgi:uncharacterized RDD family membrane protein YckC